MATAKVEEKRAREAIQEMLRAVGKLERVASTTPGTGPLASWAREHGQAFADRTRGHLDHVLWTAGSAPAIGLISDYVHRAYVKRRDLLGINRTPSPRELAWYALGAGWWPSISEPASTLTIGDVIKRTTNAIRKARRDLTSADT